MPKFEQYQAVPCSGKGPLVPRGLWVALLAARTWLGACLGVLGKYWLAQAKSANNILVTRCNPKSEHNNNVTISCYMNNVIYYCMNSQSSMQKHMDLNLNWNMAYVFASWVTLWTCLERWNHRPLRHWIYPDASAPAVTATYGPSKPDAPRTMTACLSSPCQAHRGAWRAKQVSHQHVFMYVWVYLVSMLSQGLD